jgi:hypothetical protein
VISITGLIGMAASACSAWVALVSTRSSDENSPA